MNIIEYEKLQKKNPLIKDSDSFITDILSTMPLFAKEASLYVKCKKGSILLQKGDPVDYAIITVSGEISVINVFESGKMFEPVIIRHSDFTGVVEILLDMTETITTNLANTEVEYIKIPKKVFLKWLDLDLKITRHVLNSVSFNFRKNMTESGESVLLNSMYLMVNHLLKNATLVNKVFLLKETRDRTSIRTGINIRTVYRHINKLKDSSLISIYGKHIGFTELQRDKLYEYYVQLRNK